MPDLFAERSSLVLLQEHFQGTVIDSLLLTDATQDLHFGVVCGGSPSVLLFTNDRIALKAWQGDPETNSFTETTTSHLMPHLINTACDRGLRDQ
jgi:hypothetical protein